MTSPVRTAAAIVLWGSLLGMPAWRAKAGDCPPEEPTLYLTSPAASGGAVQGFLYAGEALELEVVCRLRTGFDDPDLWVQGYSMSVKHDPEVLTILEATIEGLDTAQLRYGGVLRRTETVDNATGSGFVSSFVGLCAGETDCWFPAAGDWALVRARYRFAAPPSAPEPVGPPRDVDTAIELEDGLKGSGQPISTALTVQGSTRLPCTEALEVRVRVAESLEFFRGDANYDGALDVSDPVTLLRSQFQGDARVHCDDAGDANDDGKVDISDAIFVFGYLFLGAREPPGPVRGRGSDPTPDDLRCRPESRLEPSR